MRKILFRGSVGLTINNVAGEFFQTGKGLRQGDPLSPLLFNLVVDVLTRMLQKVANSGLIKGLGENIVEGGVISLQYADDTILFVDKEEEYARNLKWTLTCFEMLSGIRVNYHKSELVPINIEDEEEVQRCGGIFGCPCREFSN
jgi:hypothetical protein